jgi:hypothetical protein
MKPIQTRWKAIPSARIERWLGKEKAEHLSGLMKGWYGPPINLTDVPGSVWLGRDGDFCGLFERGGYDTALSALDRWFRHDREVWRRATQLAPAYSGVGFGGISDALARASGGFGQDLGPITKSGPTGVAGGASSLWRVGAQPVAGAAGSAAPGGRAPTKATTGAIAFNNAVSGSLHLTGADFSSNTLNSALMVYDRIFDVAKTMNSTAIEAVTGVPTRYQNTSPGNWDSVSGNFLFIEVGGTALAATAHNWTTCLYEDSAGNANQTLPSVTGNSGAIVDRFDMPLFQWFCPLAAGDTGIRSLDQMQCSAAVATGAINFVIGRAIGVMAFPIAQILLPFDWLTNRRLAPRVANDACLAAFELPKPSTAASTYGGLLYVTEAAP